jgi:tetratricopeptide (TPR) repeat protein
MRFKPASICLLFAASVAPVVSVSAQSPPDAPPASPVPTEPERGPTEADITEMLDGILLDVRLAEGQEGEREEAFQRALQNIAKVLRVDPENLRAEFYNARLMVLSKRERMALTRLKEWKNSREGANDWEGHYIIAQVYFNMQFYSLAKPALAAAIRLNPREPKLQLLMARCLAKLIKYPEAIEYANEAIELMGENVDPSALMLLAEILVQNKQLEAGAVAANRAKMLAADAFRTKGGSLATLGTLEQALAMQIQIVQARHASDRENLDYYVEMAHLLREQSQVTTRKINYTALTWTTKALSQAGDRPPENLLEIHIPLLIQVGSLDEAMRIAEKAFNAYPTNAEIKRYYDSLRAKVGQETTAATVP